jgi:hypothetical protein
MGGCFKGLFWFFIWTVALLGAISFPPLIFVLLAGLPFWLIWKYLKKNGW